MAAEIVQVESERQQAGEKAMSSSSDSSSSSSYDKVEDVKSLLNFHIDENCLDLDEKMRDMMDMSNRHYIVHRDAQGCGPGNIIVPNQYLKYVRDMPMQYSDYIPMPESLKRELENVDACLFMGILPEIQRVWIAVNERLYLWDYTNPDDYFIHDGLDDQIVSVAISAPKPGVFMDNVSYTLIVATVSEVVVLAVSKDSSTNMLKFIPTPFAATLNDMVMKKIVGSQSGRVFMGGADGNLYELEYDNGGAESSIAGIFAAAGVQQHKCRKLSHWSWKIINVLSLIWRADDSLADMCVDDARSLLYIVSLKGFLDVFYLGKDGTLTKQVISSVRILDLVKALPRGLSTHDERLFEDSKLKAVNSVFAVPMTESQKIHCLVVLKNGVRIYISLRDAERNHYCSFTPATSHQPQKMPASAEVVHMRLPPSLGAIKGSSPTESLPSDADVQPSLVTAAEMTTALYSHGVYLSSVTAPVAGSAEGEELFCVFEHTMRRPGSGADMTDRLDHSFREGLCLVGARSFDRERQQVLVQGMEGRVYDIKESSAIVHDIEALKMTSLFLTSKTIAVSAASAKAEAASQLALPKWLIDPFSPASRQQTHLLSQTTAIAPISRFLSEVGPFCCDVVNTITASELCFQHIPLADYASQRKFLCLTSSGMHVLAKRRPVDELYRLLSDDHVRPDDLAINHFFKQHNDVQACAMCYALACGVPADAGGSGFIDPRIPAPHTALSRIQSRAVLVVQALRLTLPSFETYPVFRTKPSSSTEALRLVASRFIRPVLGQRIVGAGETDVSPVWSRELLSSIYTPLDQLKSIIESLLKYSARPATVGAGSAASSDSIATYMQAHSHAHINDSVRHDIAAKEEEDATLRKLHMFLQRCTQALYLLDSLYILKKIKLIPVPWGRLGNTVFWEFAFSPVSHAALKTVVKDLLREVNARPEKAHIANQFAADLERHAPLFFSAGDRYEFLADRGLEELKKELHGSAAGTNAFEVKAQEYVRTLINASKFWSFVESVEDRPDQPSKLTLTTNSLASTLGMTGYCGVVDLCFATAENFGGQNSRGSYGLPLGERDAKQAPAPPTGLDGDRLKESEAQRGKRACYECLLRHLLEVKSSPQRFAERFGDAASTRRFSNQEQAFRHLVDRCMSLSDDPTFIDLLCQRLYAADAEEVVLWPFAERFLRDKEEPRLLHRFYECHHMHARAASLMQQMACSEQSIDISHRVECFRMAADSAASAVELGQGSMAYLQDVRAALDTASLQAEALAQLSSDLELLDGRVDKQKLMSSQLLSMREQLRLQLIAPSALLNEFCLPLRMWDICLLLIFSQRPEQYPEQADVLWRSWLYR